MAFERPCLVFADMDGTMYDEPDLHMLSMDMSGLSLPRPEDITPLPAQCELVLLPGRLALGLEAENGEVAIHEGCAVAALVPSNYVVTGLPAAHSDSLPPPLPSQAYAAVGFAHNRFYMAAKKIDDEPRYSLGQHLSKKAKKSAKALCAQYPDNKLVQYLINSCAHERMCWAANNLFLGKSEILLPLNPFSPCEQATPSLPPAPAGCFKPEANDFLEVMNHYAQSVTNPIISLGHPCDLTHTLEKNEAILEAITLFRQRNTTTPIVLHLHDTVFSRHLPTQGDSHIIEAFAHAGLSGISYKISCWHARSRDTATSSMKEQESQLHALLSSAMSLGLQRTLHYEYLPGLGDTEKETAALIHLVNTYGIHHIRLSNYRCDPHQVFDECQSMESLADLGPVMGMGNFLKQIKRECPTTTLVSATPAGLTP